MDQPQPPGQITRRTLLGAGAALVVAGCTPGDGGEAGAGRSAGVPSKARRGLRIGVIGAGGHGTKLARRFAHHEDAVVKTVCDPDSERAQVLQADLAGRGYTRPGTVTDLREVLADDDIDAVVVATPHHWHALAVVWAMEAGKHVYLEKPMTHHLAEGELIMDAARRTGLVVQVGTQRRSHRGLEEAAAALQDGAIGQVRCAVGYSHSRRKPIGPTVAGAVPPTVDAGLWFGPREVTPVTRQRFHYDWHWFDTFGNGGLGNNGVHRLDVVRWALGLEGRPDRVAAVGGRVLQDAGETASTMLSAVTFGDVLVLHDLRPTGGQAIVTTLGGGAVQLDKGEELVFCGEDGLSLVTTRSGGRVVDAAGTTLQRFGGQFADDNLYDRHIDDFLVAIRAGTPASVRVPPAEGDGAAAMCHGPAEALRAVRRDASSAQADWEQVREELGAMAAHPALTNALEDFVSHVSSSGQHHLMRWSGDREMSDVAELADAAYPSRKPFHLAG